MTTAIKPREWTYKDYLGLPEEGPLRYEVIDGELYMTPAPNIRHQEVLGTLYRLIGNFIASAGSSMGKIFPAPCDVVLSADPLQVVQPDLVFVSNARVSIVTERNIQGVPDLVVEILSEGTMIRDRKEKFRVYERFGVPEYWIVDQMDDSVSVYRLTQGKYPDPLILRKDEILEFPLLPGFSIRLSDVFPS
ncbi:MAG: Uma2 family endonuclease [Nitrospirae bacterium]|uniref:50S ribosomal protein L17 n=1 Tax=Leptospirillum ferriphilum YSK TaxID=1441628 RepID=A0A059XPC4_9BACT|nr:Uma2 family endonuclease [Leptospirillum ferriphilum]AIA30414.1 50S ribosomal protein L17 [Leptospirillum ferriphilum YSK]MCL4461450.1 Uma2 family endonuclease [Nitrospirota bacterium]